MSRLSGTLPPGHREHQLWKSHTTLTTREQEILSMYADGLSSTEIATRLWLSTHTVRNHVRQARAKLGARNIPHAVAIGFAEGLLG